MKIKTLTILTLGTITIFGCAMNPAKTASQQDQFLSAAKTSLANNNPTQAIADTNQALAVNINSAQAYALQAAAYQQLNNYDKAAQSFNKSLAIESGNTLYRTSYANFLCNNGSYEEAEQQYQLAANTEVNKVPQDVDNLKKAAQIYNSAGECSAKQNNLDATIANYESAISTKNAPQQAYIGITKAYLAQNNYPKAALYISSYPGDQDTAEVLQLKVKSLTGLLNSNYQISDNNRKLLKDKINTLNQKLAQMQQSNTSTITASADDQSVVHATLNDETASSAMIASSTPAAKPVTVTKPATVIAKTPATKSETAASVSETATTKPATNYVANTAPLNSRIKKASDGRRYIVVESGDTLFNIAQRSGVSQGRIVEINHLKNQYVPLGTRLYLD